MSTATATRQPVKSSKKPPRRECSVSVFGKAATSPLGWPYFYGPVHDSPWFGISRSLNKVSSLHSLVRRIQQVGDGKAIAATRIDEAPLFIIGHWRTGTTWLHELLILDERHAYPTTYECFDPNHFLLTEGFFKRC